MENDIDNSTEMQPPARKKAGFKHIFLVLRRPSQTFYHIADAGHAWLYPVLVLIVLIFVGMLVSSGNSGDQASIEEDLGLLSQSEQTIAYIIGITFIIIIGPPLYFLVAVVIPSLVFMFFGNFVMERQLGFRNYLNVTAFALCPIIILEIINLLVKLVTGGNTIAFNPDIFLPTELQATFIGYWLAYFSIFNIWVLVLLTIGLATILEKSRGRVALWLIPLFLAFATVSSTIIASLENFVSNYRL